MRSFTASNAAKSSLIIGVSVDQRFWRGFLTNLKRFTLENFDDIYQNVHFMKMFGLVIRSYTYK